MKKNSKHKQAEKQKKGKFEKTFTGVGILNFITDITLDMLVLLYTLLTKGKMSKGNITLASFTAFSQVIFDIALFISVDIAKTWGRVGQRIDQKIASNRDASENFSSPLNSPTTNPSTLNKKKIIGLRIIGVLLGALSAGFASYLQYTQLNSYIGTAKKNGYTSIPEEFIKSTQWLAVIVSAIDALVLTNQLFITALTKIFGKETVQEIYDDIRENSNNITVQIEQAQNLIEASQVPDANSINEESIIHGKENENTPLLKHPTSDVKSQRTCSFWNSKNHNDNDASKPEEAQEKSSYCQII